MHSKRKVRQAGNVFLVLLGAVAAAGVMTAGVGTVMRGPLSSSWNVQRVNLAENQLMISAKVATRAAITQQASGGDCDGDGFIEPLPFVDAGTAPKPAGGGHIPPEMGVAVKDPWNRKYGYCAFDHGSKVNDAGCGGTTQRRRAGTGISKWEAFAIISAGPDGVFQTSCNNWADANTDGAPDTPMVNKPVGSDDIVYSWTYEEAVAGSDGLWSQKAAAPNTAETDKNLSVKNAGVEQFSFDKEARQLSLGDGSTGIMPTIKTDSIGTIETTLEKVALTISEYYTKLIKPDGTLWQLGTTHTQIGTDANWIQVSEHSLHACGLKTDGSLWCWGSNTWGQLGDGTTTGNYTGPARVGTANDWAYVYTGRGQTCGMKTNGTLWCWGANSNGQLGVGDSANRGVPTQVGTAADWAKFDVGYSFACAIKTNGTLWCWGNDGNGQVGNGATTGDQTSPVQIGIATDWQNIYTGNFYACATKTDGTLWCWGYNNYGQHGRGNTTPYTSPAQVGVATDWATARFKLGYNHSCARKADSTIWCWGQNTYGQVGDGTTTQRNSPVQVGVATDWALVYAGRAGDAGGEGHTCGVKTNGQVWCWGYNAGGRLGDGTSTNRSTPVLIPSVSINLDNITPKISVGSNINAAGKLNINGTEVIDENGIIRHGEQDPKIGDIQHGKFCKVDTSGGISWAEAGPGGANTCGRKTDGTLWCWGYNNSGQLGLGDATQRTSPVQVGTTTNWAKITGGGIHTCGLRTDGTLWCWGSCGSGQIGDGCSGGGRASPVQVGTATNWAKITAGNSHTCGVKTDGTLWCWGWNTYYQLGLGDTTQRNSPVQVGTATNWADIMNGDHHGCGVKTDGTLWCWGANGGGQLGVGNTTNRSTPIQVGTATNWAKITGGGIHTCGLRTDGTLWCWGDNTYGSLGLGNTTQRTSPVQVGTATNWADIATGKVHNTCGVKTDGTLWCWGFNYWGQLGLGDATDRLSPVQVGTETNWTKVMAGGDNNGAHVCATKTNGTLWCWGTNARGQVGDGTTTLRSVPTQVIGDIVSGVLGVSCTEDPPAGHTPIQNGIKSVATIGGSCGDLGKLQKDNDGNLLVCDDDGTSQIETGTGTCGAFEPGALTFDKNMALYFCGEPPASCTLDGETVASGSSRDFFSSSSHVDCNSVKQSRTCTDGTLNGSGAYQYATCGTLASCTLDGVTVAHGASKTFYTTNSAPSCSSVSQSRTCTNGTLSGSATYNKSSCSTACVLDGKTVASGSSSYFYEVRGAANTTHCTTKYRQNRTCTNGTLSGSSWYKYQSCGQDTCTTGPIGSVCQEDGAIYIANHGNRIFTTASDGATLPYAYLVHEYGATNAAGSINTDIIVAFDNQWEPVVAAEHCRYANSTGIHTWHLPSLYEMGLMRNNRSYLTGFSGDYWTSTESSFYDAFSINVGTGQETSLRKDTYHLKTRCIRVW